MPVCQTCNSVDKKNDVSFDESYDRTTCPKCQKVGPVRDENYALSLVITEQGVAVTGRAPGLELTYADTWAELASRLGEYRQRRIDEKPSLKLVSAAEE